MKELLIEFIAERLGLSYDEQSELEIYSWGIKDEDDNDGAIGEYYELEMKIFCPPVYGFVRRIVMVKVYEFNKWQRKKKQNPNKDIIIDGIHVPIKKDGNIYKIDVGKYSVDFTKKIINKLKEMGEL